MYIYNVTVIVEDAIASNWLEWIRNQHQDRLSSTSDLSAVKILEVKDSPNEGKTYCLQYLIDKDEAIGVVENSVIIPIFGEMHNLYANMVVMYQSLMKEL